MQCRYCRAWNEEDERRCVRCGRRMQLSSAPSSALPASDVYPLATATAPALEPYSGPELVAPAPPRNVTYQPSLFRDASGGPKVIPIPTLVPARAQIGRASCRERV